MPRKGQGGRWWEGAGSCESTVVITAPLVLLFLAAQRRFIEGMTLTGIKG